MLVFALLTWLLVHLLRAWSRRWPSGATAWALSVRQLTAQPVQTMVQVSALAVGLLALMLLVLLRTDLIDSWRKATRLTHRIALSSTFNPISRHRSKPC